MPRIVIRPRAKEDLKAIWTYSFQQWGEQQVGLYLRELERGILNLTEHPDIGVPYDHIRPGYRKLHINRHLICYRHNGPRIEIVRVLHEGMDAAWHL